MKIVPCCFAYSYEHRYRSCSKFALPVALSFGSSSFWHLLTTIDPKPASALDPHRHRSNSAAAFRHDAAASSACVRASRAASLKNWHGSCATAAPLQASSRRRVSRLITASQRSYSSVLIAGILLTQTNSCALAPERVSQFRGTHDRVGINRLLERSQAVAVEFVRSGVLHAAEVFV